MAKGFKEIVSAERKMMELSLYLFNRKIMVFAFS